MGDPQGIGLDITLMAWARRKQLGLPPFVLYAEVDATRTRAHALGLDAPLAILEDARDAADTFSRALPVLPLAPDSKVEGASTVAAIERATEAVAQGQARALVTNPITKSKPGFERLPYPGHTEFLADLAHSLWGVPRPHPVMMLASDLLRVVPVTVHIPLAKVPAALTADLLGFPPPVKGALLNRLGDGWKAEQLMLLPSHSHTSIDMTAINPLNVFGIPQIGIFQKPLFDLTVANFARVIKEASREMTPILCSAALSASRPPSQDWLPPSKSTVSFLRRTDGSSKGSSVSSFMAAVAQG